jgi:hypothetical protein
MMSIVAAPSRMAVPQMIAIIIVGILAFSAIIGWMAWRFIKLRENPKSVRRNLILLGILYVLCDVIAIVDVARGKEPLQMLIGVPISLAIAWWYLRTAGRIQLPPKSD